MRIIKQRSSESVTESLHHGHGGTSSNYEFLSSDILAPLRSYIIPTSLVDVDAAIIQQLDEQRRKANLRQPYNALSAEPYAMLLEDLEPTCIASFKPKWLSQSPTAPTGWTRCRTCALHFARLSHKPATTLDLFSWFCPLDLISTDRQRVRRAAEAMVNGPAIANLLSKVLYRHPLLLALYTLQISTEIDLATRMTIRDCTVYVCRQPTDNSIRLYVGDLDVKNASLRASYWNDTESMLTNDGWYKYVDKIMLPCRLP